MAALSLPLITKILYLREENIDFAVTSTIFQVTITALTNFIDQQIAIQSQHRLVQTRGDSRT